MDPDWVDSAGCGVWKFSFARSLLPLKKVKFDEISPTFAFAAESAAREGIEEGLALAAVLLMSSMGLITGDIVKIKRNSKKF